MLFMATVSNGRKKVKRLRRRPAKTATNARTSARAMFGEEARKELPIPEFIDMYNHYMNGVDNADQLRCYYSTQRVHFKSWKPLWHFLLDTVITNSYKIAHYVPERVDKASWESHSHREFRIQLASQLFEHSERLSGRPSTLKHSLSARVYPAAAIDHGRLERIGTKPQACVVYLYTGRKVPPARPRKPLLELSHNSVTKPHNIDKRQRRQRVSRGIFGCKLCGIYICNHIGCWKEHIMAISCI